MTIDVTQSVAQQPSGETVRARAVPGGGNGACECTIHRPSVVAMVLRHPWRASSSVAACARAMPFD